MVKRRFPAIFYGLPYSQEQYDSATKSLEGISSFPEEQISLKEQKVISTNMKQLMAAHFFLISNKTHPFKHKIGWLTLYILGCCILLITILLMKPFFNLGEGILGTSLLFFAFLTVPFFRYVTFNYNAVVKDLVKQNIAQMKGWLYDYKPSHNKAKILNSQYPTIFSGDVIVGVDDEFIGMKKVDHKNYYFKSGVYEFKLKRRSGKKNKYITKHIHYIIINLNKKLNVNFLLTPEIAGGFFSNFNSKELQLESQEFNTLFKFDYQGKRSEKKAEIIKNLSPAVQLKLIKLAKRKAILKILFSEEKIVFAFKDKLIYNLNTNAYRYSGIKPNDVKSVEKEIDDIIQLSVSIIKYLD